MSEFLKNILIHDFLDSIFTGYGLKIVAVAEILAMIFLLINMAHMYWMGAIRFKDRNFWSFPEVARCIVLMVAIPIVPAAMKLIFGFAMAVAGTVEVQQSDKEQLVSYMKHKTNQFYADYESKQDLEKMKNNSYNHDNVLDKDGKVTDSNNNKSDVNLNGTVAEAGNTEAAHKPSWTDYFNVLGNPVEVIIWILDFLVATTFLLVRFVYSIFYVYFIKFLCLIGPFACAFSILPFSKEKVSEWFGVLWNALFVFTTFNLLDGLTILSMGITEQFIGAIPGVGQMSNNVDTGNAFSYDSSMPRICFLLCMIFLYLKVPYLTSLYAGSSAANQVFRDGMQTMSSFVSSAIGGFTGAKAGSGSSPRIIDNTNTNGGSASTSTSSEESKT